MRRIRKLTPEVLKRIIKEEKSKLRNKRASVEKSQTITESDVDNLTKTVLEEVKQALKLKLLRERRKNIKNKILKKK